MKIHAENVELKESKEEFGDQNCTCLFPDFLGEGNWRRKGEERGEREIEICLASSGTGIFSYNRLARFLNLSQILYAPGAQLMRVEMWVPGNTKALDHNS